jgi:BCD family chlorophyll transporter-like MFS transporter
VKRLNDRLVRGWVQIGPRFLPFADAASDQFPLERMLRLSLFQISVGMAVVLLTGTLNRVMIVELGVPAWLVSLMVALPLLFAPFRALIGHRSDVHRSQLGWRRVPYIWMGTLLQFGGLAIMPFALIVLSGDSHGPAVIGHIGAALAFLLVGVGLHTTQTAGLALATDLAPAEARPRVVALFYVMLMLGMVGSALLFAFVLRHFSEFRLIQVIQGAALTTMVLNIAALWKQEARRPAQADDAPPMPFREAWGRFVARPNSIRFLIAVALGTAGFSMQDILLEPYGGQILKLAVGTTTLLTAMLAGGTLTGFSLAAFRLGRGADPYRLAAFGALAGLPAFAAIIFAAPANSVPLFLIGTVLIGFGAGLFSVCTLTAAMNLERGAQTGLALGAWGAVQATAAGGAVALGGAIRDVVSALATEGALGPVLSSPSIGYSLVYQIEIVLLFAALVAVGPLVRSGTRSRSPSSESLSTGKFGLAEFPS